MIKLRAIELFRNAKFLVIAVESAEFKLNKMDILCQISGKMEPIAVVICGPNGNYALDMQTRPTALNELRLNIPELDDMIALFNNV